MMSDEKLTGGRQRRNLHYHLMKKPLALRAAFLGLPDAGKDQFKEAEDTIDGHAPSAFRAEAPGFAGFHTH